MVSLIPSSPETVGAILPPPIVFDLHNFAGTGLLFFFKKLTIFECYFVLFVTREIFVVCRRI